MKNLIFELKCKTLFKMNNSFLFINAIISMKIKLNEIKKKDEILLRERYS